MRQRSRYIATMLCLAAALCVGAAAARSTTDPTGCRKGSARFARVDLFFGAGSVGRQAWARFLAGVVTPRFPDGLTSFEGAGQWRGPAGLVAEPSRVLVIYYRPGADSDKRIEAIRSAYMKRFAQTSVLRADSTACISF